MEALIRQHLLILEYKYWKPRGFMQLTPLTSVGINILEDKRFQLITQNLLLLEETFYKSRCFSWSQKTYLCWNKHFGRQEVSAEHTKYADVERNILEENRFQLITPNMLWNKNEKINLEPLSATVTTFFFPFFISWHFRTAMGLPAVFMFQWIIKGESLYNFEFFYFS